MYFDLVSLAHSHPPSHIINSTSGQLHWTPLIKMRIRHNSSKNVKLQAFGKCHPPRLICHWQLNTDFLCVLCLELRSPKTTQMPAPPPPGGPPGGSPSPWKFSCLQCRFLGPCQNARLAFSVPTLGLNTVKSGSETTSFQGLRAAWRTYWKLHSRPDGNTIFTVLRDDQSTSFWTLF